MYTLTCAAIQDWHVLYTRSIRLTVKVGVVDLLLLLITKTVTYASESARSCPLLKLHSRTATEINSVYTDCRHAKTPAQTLVSSCCSRCRSASVCSDSSDYSRLHATSEVCAGL